VPSSETPLAHVAVGIAVRTGQPKPDISTADKVKKLLLDAKSISYPAAAGGAAAGVSFDKTMQQLGIADAMKPKIKPGQGGRGAMALLAKGDVDIGLTFVSEIITEPGVEAVGPLPRDISPPTELIA
jgi:molybdate transport system substrate-binding protein